MKPKLKNKLVNALKRAGMSESLVTLFDGKSDEEIQNFINELPESDSTEEMTADELTESPLLVEALETLGFDKVLSLSKKMQSEHDKKVGVGIKKFKNRILGNKEDDEDDEEKGKGNKGKGAPEGAPDWFAEYARKQDERFEKLAGQFAADSNQEKVSKALKGSKLPEKLRTKWASRIDPESETSIEDQVKELEEEYKEVYTDIAGDNSYSFEDSRTEGKTGDMSKSEEKELKEMASNL